MFDDNVIEFECGGKCGRMFQKTIGWLRTHTHLVCDQCGTDNVLDASHLIAAAAAAEDRLKNL